MTKLILRLLAIYSHSTFEKPRSYLGQNQRHDGLDIGILAKRKELYQKKRNEHTERWSKSERNWQPIGAVELNPEQYKEAV